MNLSFWSDEDKLFVPKRVGFGWSINFKFIAKKLGLIKSPTPERPEGESRLEQQVEPRERESRAERLKRQIEESRYEDRR